MIVPSLSSRIGSVAWSAILAFLILGFGREVWEALLFANLRTGPAIPWAVAVMSLILWLMWQYLSGKGWPQRTSETRRRYLRANQVSGQAWTWAMLAGVLSIVALAGYWIVMFQLVQMPGNVLPDFSKYPRLAVVLMLVMASLVSPITEEAAFRGYCQVILERQFRGGVAVLVSSVLFALAHVTQGFLCPKLLVYFLAGVAFGVMAYLTGSILPGIAVHIIVGVVRDSKYESLREESYSCAYFPITQAPGFGSGPNFMVRTSVRPSALLSLIQAAVAGVNKSISLQFDTLARQVDDSLVQERVLATLSCFFAGLALLLVMVGLYGAISYTVTLRQTELGVRMALGAAPGSILRLVLRDVVVILATGVVAGAGLALLSVQLLQNLLFGLAARDLLTMALAAGVLSLVGFIAGYVPARRATKVDPTAALRYE